MLMQLLWKLTALFKRVPYERKGCSASFGENLMLPILWVIGQLRACQPRVVLQMLDFSIFYKFTNRCFSLIHSSWQGLVYSPQDYFPWAICLENRDLLGFPHSLLPQSVCLPLSSFGCEKLEISLSLSPGPRETTESYSLQRADSFDTCSTPVERTGCIIIVPRLEESAKKNCFSPECQQRYP